MHRVAEAGVAAHWLYKTGDQPTSPSAQQTHRWLQSLLEIARVARPGEFLEHIKGDLFPDAIYVPPKGRSWRCSPARRRSTSRTQCTPTSAITAPPRTHEPMPRTELKNGDQVEIMTLAARPNPSWLNFVATGKARSRIRHFLKSLQQRESAGWESVLGRPSRRSRSRPRRSPGSLGGAGPRIRRQGQLTSSPTSASAAPVFWSLSAHARGESLVRGVGANPAKAEALQLRGVEGVAIQYAKRRRPIPGDAIVGQFRRGQD
jgi:GTP pyrophosphokinase